MVNKPGACQQSFFTRIQHERAGLAGVFGNLVANDVERWLCRERQCETQAAESQRAQADSKPSKSSALILKTAFDDVQSAYE